MDKLIKLQLSAGLIIEAVKNETFFRGQVIKAADERAITEAFHEQAGDEAYQERILRRGLVANLEELKTQFSDYLSTTNGNTTADNAIDSEEENGIITISLTVGERFNQAYVKTLARLSAEYITNGMLMDWWRPVNEKQSALYAQFITKNLAAIKRCFNKTAPVAPTTPYTLFLTAPGTAIELAVGEEYTVTYSISDGAIDDIEVRIEDPILISAGRSEEGFTIKGKQLGHTYIQLYSRHNEDLTKTIHVYVTDHK